MPETEVPCTNPNTMIWHARSLQRVAKKLEEENKLSDSDDLLLYGTIIAVPVLLSFGTEVALKAWQCQDRKGKHKKEHNLLKLYEGLAPALQQLIIAELPLNELMHSWYMIDPFTVMCQTGLYKDPRQQPDEKYANDALKCILRFHGDAFTDWRYIYERSTGQSFMTVALEMVLMAVTGAYVKKWGC